MITSKNEEIAELKKRIDEISSDFAEMLKDTLTKMQERIEFSNKSWRTIRISPYLRSLRTCLVVPD